MRTSTQGVELIKEFEGLRLEAYSDPGSGGEPYTIGYGHTGGVRPGDRITEAEAEDLLKQDLAKFEQGVERLAVVQLGQGEFDALVSFSFNVGLGALEASTLLRRLNAGEPRCTVYSEEMPRWNKGANGPMPGLVRRREAEAEMACQGAFVKAVDDQEDCFMVRAAKHYNEEPHQKAAWEWLEDLLDDVTLEGFKARYRASQAPQKPSEPPRKPSKPKFPLNVPYYTQLDSEVWGQAERSCFSSAMAMALEYVDPEGIDGDDDDYLRIVLQYGDTVSSEAQVKAARSLGYDVEFRTDGTEQDLLDQLDRGIPIPVGILHKGFVDKPTGGGHYIVLTGYDDTYFYVNDPMGDLDLIGGGYTWASRGKGEALKYTRKNLLKRWNIANDHDGWYVSINR